ncbi:MAG: DUF4956 domain-containing protein [Treponema sp.]|uniref:DUF4956 domain-containing protein n=1 Tax=Treponema sp. TaxID=166 RepID=UPI0025CCCD2F|nr:DUF4956 domain-containing protein [Treponema sp.]MBQ9281257.1 DUF4956 domain-containing protein [Treponema sp.]
MSFKDIFKKSFLEGFSRYDMSPTNIIIVMTISTAFAFYIFMAYRFLTRKTFYSKSFNISLAAVTVITTGIILTIQSSVVISLGMVGALSIVRFRTAVKDPMDLAFLFWAISTGIICGAGLAEIACVLAFVLSIGLFLLDRIPVGRAPQILMVSARGYDAEKAVMEAVKKYSAASTVKSRRLSNDQSDFVIELRTLKFAEPKLIQEVASLECVISSSLLRHDGEVTY